MNKNNLNSIEYLEIKNMLCELTNMVKMLTPQKASISYLSSITGRSRQSIRQFLINNFEPEVDFWITNGRICVSQKVAITILMRSSK
ncbi:hypothetical protein AFAEC_1767 [Aliarcobacter faecis]|uniref:hypothetical protein n=1 Tax=Aliarcobacter faecis TaxID=1564138 RepID=UPI00047CF5A7|nr:hypothetical protein [Aliarcobacter faecis]QKF73919.1 hypothetical protein AFAEC_1767 [Aliarcobacter faecis]